MQVESGGDKCKTAKDKNKNEERIIRKTRSHSASILPAKLKTFTADIKTNQEECSTADKNKAAKSTLDKFEREIQGDTIINSDIEMDEVFKPRHSVCRSPIKDISEKEQPITKIQRSESSPDIQINKKRQFGESIVYSTDSCNIYNENFLMQIFVEMDKIYDAVKKPPSNLESVENCYSSIKEAHNNLHKYITLLAVRYGTLENKNILNQQEIKNLKTAYTGNTTKVDREINLNGGNYVNKKKNKDTYASILNTNQINQSLIM